MRPRRVLVGGIGNVFFGDDGFGVEVARLLRARPDIPGVDVVDFGIRGLDLAYALLEGYDAAVLVDTVARGRVPGTLSVIELGVDDVPEPSIDTHGMHPVKVLALARAMGPLPPALRVVGCEPSSSGGVEEMAMGLSPAVAAAVPRAAEMVEELVLQLREGVGADA